MPINQTPSRTELVNLFLAYILANSPLNDIQPTSTLMALANANAVLVEEWFEALNLQTPQAVLTGLYELFTFNGLPATPSQTTLSLTGTPGTFIPTGSIFSTQGTPTFPSIGFSTTQSGTLSTSGTASIPAQSIPTGSNTNVGAGTIVQIATPIIGLSTVTNPQAAVGGTNAESASAQRQRFAQFLQSLKGATAPAIGYGLGPVNQPTVNKITVIPPFTLQEWVSAGGNFTNISASCASPKGVPVAPFSSSPNVGDAFYIGFTSFFTKLYFDVAQAGSGWTVAWQYWSQTLQTWNDLTVTLDETNVGMQSGTVTWDIPADWVPTAVNGQLAFWIRIVVNATTYTTQPLYYQILPLTPPPGFVEIAYVPPLGTPASVTQTTLAPLVPQWVGASETGTLVLATQQSLDVSVSITPTIYGSGVLTTGFLVNVLTQFINNLAIGQAFDLSQATYALQSTYQGEAVAVVSFSAPTQNVYVPVDTLLVPGTLVVTLNAI